MEAISLFGITTIIRIIIHVTVTCSLFNEKKNMKEILTMIKILVLQHCIQTLTFHLIPESQTV